jgi:hypothetical protein
MKLADENGLRHVLLCKVILGRVENVPVDSKQSQPSCRQYDTGVDDILSPRKHIIWTAFMNSHIHPEYIVSFKYNYVKGKFSVYFFFCLFMPTFILFFYFYFFHFNFTIIVGTKCQGFWVQGNCN